MHPCWIKPPPKRTILTPYFLIVVFVKFHFTHKTANNKDSSHLLYIHSTGAPQAFSKNGNLCPCGRDLGELSARLSGCASGWGQCHLGERSGKILLRRAAYPPQLHGVLPVGIEERAQYDLTQTARTVPRSHRRNLTSKAIHEILFCPPWLLAPPCERSPLGSEAPGLAGWWSRWPVGHPHQNWTI